MTAGWTLRPFTPADAPALAALLGLTGRVTTPEALLAADAARPAEVPRRWLLVDERGEVLSGSQLRPFAFLPPTFRQVGVLVLPQWRGQGVGQRLWVDAKQAAEAEGAGGLSADVSDTDAASLAWAQRRGFAIYTHRFASELDLTAFDPTPFQADVQRAVAQGVTFTDLSSTDETTLQRYLNSVADRLTETPDLMGYPRWSLAQVRAELRLDRDPRPDWLVVALGPQGQWWGTSATLLFRDPPFAYNALTAIHSEARGRRLALPLKLEGIARAQAAGLSVMRTNNHASNAPMLAVNRRLGFEPRPGRYEVQRRL
ncbi:GNAT family N-acetyltransferase [Deinococcus sp. HMF7620]|uniref:GNAT family N-acetyltransferase n=1 Tax=Deinococcus arboris TaxID=2682977 RepID=A0A7C9HV41_9DEIO|nr:GNAT family N-acetyltransferase [Deinococcus arboris]